MASVRGVIYFKVDPDDSPVTRGTDLRDGNRISACRKISLPGRIDELKRQFLVRRGSGYLSLLSVGYLSSCRIALPDPQFDLHSGCGCTRGKYDITPDDNSLGGTRRFRDRRCRDIS